MIFVAYFLVTTIYLQEAIYMHIRMQKRLSKQLSPERSISLSADT